MKYKNYKLEDFLIDKEFIAWIKNPTQESNKFWQAVIQDRPEKKEVFEEAIKLAKLIHFRKLPTSQKSKDRILANTISLRYSSRSKAQNVSLRKFNWVFVTKIAAAILILISIGSVLFLESRKWVDDFSTISANNFAMITKENPPGRKSKLNLPDGSSVTLNAESKIIFPNVFKDKREVWLTGEASFEVEENPEKSFLVHTKNLTIMVKGTTFNVKAFSNDLNESVSLLSGKVSITHKDEHKQDEKYDLIPGEKLSLNLKSNQLIVSDLNMDEVVWRSGILVFKNDQLDTFIEKIQRWYGVSVDVIGTPKEKININGKFDNESLEIVLESLKFSIGINYEIIDNRVQIKF